MLTLAKITGHKDLNMLMVYYGEDKTSPPLHGKTESTGSDA